MSRKPTDPTAEGAQMSFDGRMSYSDYLHLERVLEHVPIICTHSLHDGSSWRHGGRSTVERMNQWRGRGEE